MVLQVKPGAGQTFLLAAVHSSLEPAFEPSAEVGHGFVGSGLVTRSGFRVICVLLTLSPAGRMAPERVE